ncbi:efflux RND transporter periplasmic adaptor subunit [Acinetobacter baumannii]|uniref:efflux RND transporter periplasmic adaptor subunit n=1 Tax=Acinetobacter TaxID=469 RepID=UPI001D170ED3|nr:MULTISPECIES: efflux RND transporter periplasmic adaptor subunit [Acinetobacter]MCW8528242.1 efflux RND transporter periplasmic adaptor subunit [Acinetobacter baumannii]MCW8531995.1 efflux RND transporter periplasmic adaptor subunit [Acinetobacter baumannii]MCW8543087.1 efflux RND transporter periplasmic adaptor subunit [Acinetobacter baumannii]MCW8553993.1 efflux RND transporter periplasmic adaptor subunit [Acinetobacter baumannii]MCW8557460.1 efflux RND transporter periplasmic adaptor sub
MAISGGLLYTATNKPDAPNPQAAAAQMPVPQVPVAEVITRELNPTAEYTGYLSAPQSVEIKSRVGGVINSVSVPEGSYVRKGQVLFKIDPEPFQVALNTAQARLKAAEVQYSQAVLDFNRANKLVESGAVSNKVYDDALATKNNRQAQVQEAQAAVSAAKLDLSYTNITAPISGRIDRVLVTSGNLIAGGNTGNATALTTIVSVNPLYVYFDLDEKTFLNLKGQNKSGQFNLPIEMGLANTETYPYTGKLNFVSTQIDQRTGTLRVRASIANDSGELAPGMFARVKLTTGNKQSTILIDDQAVGTDQGNNFVLVLGSNNTVEFRPVTLGSVFDGLRIISSGLQTGDKVIIKGLVRPGMQVKPNIIPMQAPVPSENAAQGK